MLTHLDTLPEALASYQPKIDSGWAGAFHIDGTHADLVLSVGITKDSDQIAMWVEAIRGTVGFRPKLNLELMRDVLEACEVKARELGCTELRIEQGTRFGWKIALLSGFGFSEKHVNQSIVYRKALLDG